MIINIHEQSSGKLTLHLESNRTVDMLTHSYAPEYPGYRCRVNLLDLSLEEIKEIGEVILDYVSKVEKEEQEEGLQSEIEEEKVEKRELEEAMRDGNN